MTQPTTTQGPPPGGFKMLAIDQIKAEASIQARVEMDMQTVATYHERMVAGDRFPPIVVFDDGMTLWLADGFHRLAAAKRTDQKQIDARVIDGSHGDAAWFALGANRTNGLPMSTADKVRAIKQALMLRAHESNRLIASHIGVSDHTVAKYRKELEAGAQIAHLNTTVGADGKEYPARRPVDNDPPPPPPSTVIDTPPPPPVVPDEPPSPPKVDPPPSTTDQPPSVPPPPPVVPELPKDRVGNPITDPRIAEIFKRDHELVELCSAVSKIKMTVLKAAEAGDPLYVGMKTGHFKADAENLRREIDHLRPYAICPYCWGTQPKVTSCQPCRARGCVSEFVYELAPEDRKRGRQ